MPKAIDLRLKGITFEEAVKRIASDAANAEKIQAQKASKKPAPELAHSAQLNIGFLTLFAYVKGTLPVSLQSAAEQTKLSHRHGQERKICKLKPKLLNNPRRSQRQRLMPIGSSAGLAADRGNASTAAKLSTL